MDAWLADVRGRMGAARISQAELAQVLGVSPGALSQWLRGVTRPPEGFEERARAALVRLEAAERAAQEARERVLAETQEGQ